MKTWNISAFLQHWNYAAEAVCSRWRTPEKRVQIHEKGATWKNFKHQTCPEFSYEWLEAELDTGMIPQIWTAKKLLLTFMTNR